MTKTPKRSDYLDWDETFMLIANLIGQRSKDPNTQVGACIVNQKNRIVGLGYNGLPSGLDDDKISWSRDGQYSQTKYPYVVHAEANAILNLTTTAESARIYVSMFPCNECAKLIIQSGITEVIYHLDKYHDQEMFKVSRALFKMANVKTRQYTPKHKLLLT